MSIIFNGTTLDSSANIKYNGTSLNKIVFNGVEVWKKYPSIKDIIKINLGDNYGTKRFKVLNISGSIAEVMLLNTKSLLEYKHNFNDSSVTTTFTGSVTTGQKYADSALDNYLNNTWYSGLSDEIKTAIVQKDITQDMWNKLSETPTENPSANNWYYELNNTYYGYYGYAPVGNRYVYAPSFEEIFYCIYGKKYTSASGTHTMLNYLFADNLTSSSDIYLRSASAAYSDKVPCIYMSGDTNFSAVISFGDDPTEEKVVRPTFQIDLTNISWT